MGIFNKRITLYVNSLTKTEDLAEGIADAASALHDHYRLDDWLVQYEEGSFERLCNCGRDDCADTGRLQ